MKTLTRLLLPVMLLLPLTSSASDWLTVRDPKSWWRSGQGTIEQAVLSVRPVGVSMEYGLCLTFPARDLAGGAGAGSHVDVTWNGTDDNGLTVNSGVFFAVYRTAEAVRTLKLMMLK